MSQFFRTPFAGPTLRLRPLASSAATRVATALLVAACSSNNADDKRLDSAGGSGAVGTGGSSSGGKGGTTGGSSGSGSGGSANASSGGSGGTTGASGGSANASSGGSGNASAGGSSNAGSGGSGAYPTDACDGLEFAPGGQAGEGSEACSGVSSEAEPVPVDLFIMMDRSVSMANKLPSSETTRWEALQAAVEAFATSNNGDDIRAGIGFFGITGGNDDAIDCDTDRYSTPAVDIGDLAEVGSDLVAAMADMRPGGLTPVGPALAGALEYASAWAEDNVGRATAVVLVSDGYPTQCQPNTVSGLAEMAELAHENAPFVRTYVIGLGADFNLNNIALGGGTHEAFIVDEGDFASSFTDALHNVANTKIACEYALPPPPDGSQTLDLEKVQVTYTTAGDETTEEIPALASINGCGVSANGGWYYDNPADPTRILVCPCTCSRFGAGRVDVRVGCRPRIGPR
jgi:hypothetical protein